MTINKTVIYARVSSKEQEQEGFSIPSQLKLLKDYALSHDMVIVREFVDVETAKKAGRENFGEMVKFLNENKNLKTILVEKTDRLYRNFKDYVTIDELDLEIHLVKEGEVLSQNSRSHQKFIHGIKVLLAKNYIDNLAEETSKGLKEKAEQGFFPSRAPLGYINVECNGKKIIQIDPEMAPKIKKLFEWYATGEFSLLQIAQKAFDDGLVYKISGGKVHKSIIAHILHNPIYYGDFNWRGEIYHGNHEPIITRELFNHVQNIFEEREGRRTRTHKYTWSFQGLISCGHCGCAMVAERKKGKYIYYHCTGYKGRCNEPYVREEEIAKQFGDALSQIQIDADILVWLKEALHASFKDEKQYHKETLDSLERNYKRLQDRLDAIYVDKLDGKINEESYLKFSQQWRQEQETIRQKIAWHEKSDRNYIDSGVQLLELAAKARTLYDSQPLAERKKLLKYVLSNSTWKDGKLTPIYKEPFDLLAISNISYQKQKAANKSFSGFSEIWLPR